MLSTHRTSHRRKLYQHTEHTILWGLLVHLGHLVSTKELGLHMQ